MKVVLFGADKHFHMTMAGNSVADVSGDWTMQRDSASGRLVLLLKVTKAVSGKAGIEGTTIGLLVDRLHLDRMYIVTAKGEDVYRRVGGGG